jgi:RimJ/RimL family protein N-acetyltransferase
MALIGKKHFHSKSGQEVTIRDARPDDAERLLVFLNALLKDGEGQVRTLDEGVPTLEQERAWVRGMRENPDELVLLAEVGEEIVGLLDFHQLKAARLKHGGWFGTGLPPAWRSDGIGSMLVGSLLEWAPSAPTIQKIDLAVLANNSRAIGLYKKFGFREEGRRERYIRVSESEFLDDVLMAKFVR